MVRNSSQHGPRRSGALGRILASSLTVVGLCVGFGTAATAQSPYLWQTIYDSVGATGTRSLRGVAVSADELTVYTGWIQGSSTRAMRLVDPATGAVLSTTNVGASAFNELDVDDRGFVYAARGSTSSSLAIYNSATSATLGAAATGSSNNNGVSVLKDGSTYYAYLATDSAVRRFDVTDESAPTLDTAWASSGVLAAFGGAVLRGIHVDSSGVLYVTARDSNQVFRVSAGLSPIVTATSTDVTRPIAVNVAEGNVVVTAYNGTSSLIAFLHPTTLALLGTTTTGHTRGSLEGYAGLAVTSAGEIYLADQIYGGTGSNASDRVLRGSPNHKTFDVPTGTSTVTALLAGDGGIIKVGAGTLVLTGTNSYTGTTSVNVGTLRVNGDQSAAFGGVSVAAGATLGGTGVIGGATSIAGVHAPGASPGLQTFLDGVTYVTDSTFEWELIANTANLAARGTSYDGVDVAGGTLTIQAAVHSDLVFNGIGSTVDWSDSFWDADQQWRVFENANPPSGLFDNGEVNVSLDSQAADLSSVRPGAGFYWATDGNDVVLNYAVAVPDTPTPTATPTDDPGTPTPTDTPIPDTPTPTNTPIPDTPTPTSTPTDTPIPPAAFEFAGFSWSQDDTPDVILTLAPGSVNGAIVTSVPFEATSNIGAGFPSDPTGFNAALTLGRMLSLSGSGTRAVNLPAGNNGTAERSGFQVSWSGGRKLQNLPGPDFVVYESASNSSTPEAFMVQVYDLASASWSPWYYQPVDGFQVYTGSASSGATATAFDLTDLGIGDGLAIDRIRLVNMTNQDRMADPSRIGVVLPEDNGSTSTYQPDPGPSASFSFYGASTLDPDPLYIASLHSVDAAACGNGVVEPGAGEQCDPGPDDPDDCCDASCHFIADATPCDDDDYCTVDTVCAAGACAGAPRDCDDGNQCTTDSCDSMLETCVNDASAQDGQGCDDGLFCTVTDTCTSGVCLGVSNSCDDGNECTLDSCDEGLGLCLHDGPALDGNVCDDGDACTATSTCDAGTCIGSGLILVCGDGQACGSEQCDDGNSNENDGCSSQCEFEHLLTRREQTCIKAINLAVGRVADIQGKVSAGCVRDGGRGTIANAQTCVELDARGRVGGNQSRALRLVGRACTTVPSFGAGDVGAANDAARDEAIELLADVFGPDLQDALIQMADDRAGALCQQWVSGSYEKLAAMLRREFYACKSARMKLASIRSRAGMESCFDNWSTDPRGKLLKARQRLARTIDDKCADVDHSIAFPGACSSRPDIAACIEEQIACRVCRTLNVTDALDADCDWIDDGAENVSCP